jgi:hypothetical protein
MMGDNLQGLARLAQGALAENFPADNGACARRLHLLKRHAA